MPMHLTTKWQLPIVSLPILESVSGSKSYSIAMDINNKGCFQKNTNMYSVIVMLREGGGSEVVTRVLGGGWDNFPIQFGTN